MILGYWNIQGLAEPIRQLLHILNIQVDEIFYEGEEGNKKWVNEDKKEIKSVFPNLPFLKLESGEDLCQSQAIKMYLINKSGKYQYFFGNNPIEQAKNFEILGHIEDIRQGVVKLCYDQNFEQIKEESYQERFKSKLEMLESIIGKRQIINGELLKLQDIELYQALILIEAYIQVILERFS